MPVSTPNGYLDFTNATPRATKVIATSNVGVGISNPEFGLDVHGTANVGTLTATTATVSGNVYAPNLPLATIGSNLVTWNDSTGVFQDSGGLFSNKLAVVSEQPPSALAGASTTITNHGVYKVTASTGSPENAFDKSGATSWTTSSDYGGGGGTGVYVPGTARLHTSTEQGHWIALEFPYKTTLRHLTFTGNTEKANLYATNDNITWTELKNWESGETTVVVDASGSYKKYGLVTTKTSGNVTLSLTELRFFTESFAIDGGKVAMASAAITGGNTVVDQTGPHARASPPLRKYPEIVFTEGEFDGNDTTNTYTQGGYTVSSDSVYSDRQAYRVFNGKGEHGGPVSTAGYFYSSEDAGENGYNQTTGLPISGVTFQDENGTSYTGHYLKLQFPNKVKLHEINILSYKNIPTGTNDDRRPYEGTFLGSNDGTNWHLLKTYNNGDVTWSEINFEGDQYSIATTLSGITNTNYYSYVMFVIEKLTPNNAYGVVNIIELEYYGYEEDPPAGDTSVDTTITSQFNLPDTTGVKLYIDGDKGSTPTDYSGEGHTLTDNSESFSGNAWSFSSLATSNVTMSTGDFAMEGTHPHSVSLWFNCANVTSNATLFHVGTEAGEGDAKTSISLTETGHLGWIDGGDNQFLSSNTWHNLVYATQGAGGLRTCYLDGRKLGDAQVQDTFGDYPPFAMTDYSQGGYTVSASSEGGSGGSDVRLAYAAFNDNPDGSSTVNVWQAWTADGNYTGSPGVISESNTTKGTFVADGTTYIGEWIKLEMPHRLKIESVYIASAAYNQTYFGRRPYAGAVLGSNDGTTWHRLKAFDGDLQWVTTSVAEGGSETYIISDSNKSEYYKYFLLVVEKIQGGGGSTSVDINEIKIFGHKENDTTRFPVSSTVLKYPHIAMSGYAQRGYVVTASSYRDDATYDYRPYKAFNGIFNSGVYQGWVNQTGLTEYNGTDYLYNASINLGTGAENGEWIKLELPRKVLMTSMTLYSRDGDSTRAPEDFKVYGSNDDSNWTELLSEVGATPADTGTNYSADTVTTYYKYFALVVRKIAGQNDYFAIDNIEYYGTEEDLDIVAHVGEGLDGKVANFRVYDKYLHEEQALELWDAQKDQFGRATSSVSVYKGHVGIGTTEPEAALTVMDEAHESEEFPPRAMTADETYMDGHGVFRTFSPNGVIFNSGYGAWHAFDKNVNNLWVNDSQEYGTDGIYNGGTNTGIIKFNGNGTFPDGPWVGIEMPYKTKIESFVITSRAYSQHEYEFPRKFSFYGTNGNDTWTLLKIFDNVSSPGYGSTSSPFYVYSDTYYSKYVFIWEENQGGGSGDQEVTLSNISLFGTRERGQSTLHDGELKLTKNLTVPRIGPPLDADDTPRRDKLVVEYNTSTNPTENEVVRDTSGWGLDGLMYNGASYNVTEKALVFDGTDDYLIGSGTGTGGWAHTQSFWFKSDIAADDDYLTFMGTAAASQAFLIMFRDNKKFTVSIYGEEVTSSLVVQDNIWYHAVVTYVGGAFTSSNVKVYINGTAISTTHSSSLTPNITGTNFSIGATTSGSNAFNGSISNFKLYDVALTATEVKRLYDMGRLGNVIAQPVHIAAPLQVDKTLRIPIDGTAAGTTGMIRFNTSSNKLQVYNGTIWSTIGGVSASGGTVTYADGYTIHTFTTDDDFMVYSGGDVEYLIVAGGGGGGSGGGGAGGLLTGSITLTAGTYAITVGPGGAGGGGGGNNAKDDPFSGTDSTALGYTADGGGKGGGGNASSRVGSDGGSGGGHGYDNNSSTRTSGTSGQGNGGGRAGRSGLGGAGGGGGAGGAGNDGFEIYGGNGGIGVQSSITGTATYYAGGGGGGLNQNDNTTYTRPSGETYGGFGGQGGGGAGTTYGYSSGGTSVNAENGTDNTGGGGGGTDPELNTGGDGGDGIVIIRYLT